MSVIRISPRWKHFCAMMLITFSADQSLAANDETLVRILTRAFVAQNLTIYCAQFNPEILRITTGKQGDISQFAQHIREKIIDGLPPEEAGLVVQRSADAARAGALMAIRRFYQADREREKQLISAWCTQSIPNDVMAYVRFHDERHDMLMGMIASAKAPM